MNDKTIAAHTRAIIRYGLEINDPDLPELIRCADNGESILENIYVASSEEKIEALTDLICRATDSFSNLRSPTSSLPRFVLLVSLCPNAVIPPVISTRILFRSGRVQEGWHE